jgi:hypothetical protein
MPAAYFAKKLMIEGVGEKVRHKDEGKGFLLRSPVAEEESHMIVNGILVGSLLLPCFAQGQPPPMAPSADSPSPPSRELVQAWGLSPKYKKCLMLGPVPILGTAKLQDVALAEAHWVLSRMMEGRDDLLKAIADQKIRIAIMAYDERTLDVPEHSDLKPADYWNRRARGLGATKWRPAISGAEENLLELKGDPYRGENILIHEFGHVVHEIGLARVDPTFDGRLKKAYEEAMAKGLWKGGYAATNHKEYWAEGVQAWFDCNDSRNLVVTRAELVPKDKALADLLKEVFGDKPWRYFPPSKRPQSETAHLKGFDPAKGPVFQWSEQEQKAKTK